MGQLLVCLYTGRAPQSGSAVPARGPHRPVFLPRCQDVERTARRRRHKRTHPARGRKLRLGLRQPLADPAPRKPTASAASPPIRPAATTARFRIQAFIIIQQPARRLNGPCPSLPFGPSGPEARRPAQACRDRLGRVPIEEIVAENVV